MEPTKPANKAALGVALLLIVVAAWALPLAFADDAPPEPGTYADGGGE